MSGAAPPAAALVAPDLGEAASQWVDWLATVDKVERDPEFLKEAVCLSHHV